MSYSQWLHVQGKFISDYDKSAQPVYLYHDSQADLVIESYANFKNQSGPGCYIIIIANHVIN